MADLISREAILEEIDKTKYHWQEYEVVRYALSHIPAVDAVEVVRCKDCKHISHLQGAKDDAHVCALGWGLRGIIAEEDFCSYGKRREENAVD